VISSCKSWFYKWRDRPPPTHEGRWQRLAEEIEEIFHGSGGTYGSPKVFIELAQRLASIGEHGCEGHGRTWAGRTEGAPSAVADEAGQAAVRPGLRAPGLHRRGPDLVWVVDLTEIETGEGKSEVSRHSARTLLRQTRCSGGHGARHRHSAR
jgi:hypothetical protein